MSYPEALWVPLGTVPPRLGMLDQDHAPGQGRVTRLDGAEYQVANGVWLEACEFRPDLLDKSTRVLILHWLAETTGQNFNYRELSPPRLAALLREMRGYKKG